eukprot:410021-Pleurochrysis_carterae.AAC.3
MVRGPAGCARSGTRLLEDGDPEEFVGGATAEARLGVSAAREQVVDNHHGPVVGARRRRVLVEETHLNKGARAAAQPPAQQHERAVRVAPALRVPVASCSKRRFKVLDVGRRASGPRRRRLTAREWLRVLFGDRRAAMAVPSAKHTGLRLTA